MTPELMPCPFCGGSPVIEVDHGLWEARCTMTGSPDCGVWPAMYGETRDRAVAGWNHRASSPSSTTAAPAMTLNEEPAACGYCSSADFREDDDQKFDVPAFGHRHLHSGCRNEIVMAIRATMQVTMSESTVRDYHRLREALGVGPDVSFDHCITLVRQYVYYGKNPPSDATCDQCRLPLRRTLSDEALRAVVRDGDKSIGESLDALNELNRRSGCALPSSRALSSEEQAVLAKLAHTHEAHPSFAFSEWAALRATVVHLERLSAGAPK